VLADELDARHGAAAADRNQTRLRIEVAEVRLLVKRVEFDKRRRIRQRECCDHGCIR
jgi:hypothetical protein